MMITCEFEKAIAEGKNLIMKKYKYQHEWSEGKIVSAEVAEKKSKVRVHTDYGDFCPYSFEFVE